MTPSNVERHSCLFRRLQSLAASVTYKLRMLAYGRWEGVHIDHMPSNIEDAVTYSSPDFVLPCMWPSFIHLGCGQLILASARFLLLGRKVGTRCRWHSILHLTDMLSISSSKLIIFLNLLVIYCDSCLVRSSSNMCNIYFELHFARPSRKSRTVNSNKRMSTSMSV